jgi:hypothetical protein
MSVNNSSKKAYHKKITSKETKQKRKNFAKVGGLNMANQMPEPISSMVEEHCQLRFQKKKLIKQQTTNWENNHLIGKASRKHIMKLNQEKLKKHIRNNRDESSIMANEMVYVNKKTEQYIKNNFDERIQNDAYLRTFIDKIIFRRK